MRLQLSFEAKEAMLRVLDSLEQENYQEPYLTFEKDNDISMFDCNYKITISAEHTNPIIGLVIYEINCIGDVEVAKFRSLNS
jgi:hypothetical protein